IVNSRAAIKLHDDALVKAHKEDSETAHARGWYIDGRLAALQLSRDMHPDELADGLKHLEDFAIRNAGYIRVDVDGVWMDEVWDIVRFLTILLNEEIPILSIGFDCSELKSDFHGLHLVASGKHKVYVEHGASVESQVLFDTSAGPVLIRKGAQVQAFTRVVGPCYIGENSIVGGDRVAACSIGDNCRVHGEISNTILIGHSNKGHDGFVGHSILGRWVNLGAGTTTSNLKNTYGNVALWTPNGIRETGLQFLGTMFGDHVKTGIGLVLTTGTVLGTAANVFERMPPKVVEPFAWGSSAPYGTYEPAKFVEAAGRMMSRRHVELTDTLRASLLEVHAARWHTN
ncbi:MAG: hypothetical protein ABJB66_21510, partial [Gemmatimonadaceae bacterium]